MRTIGRRASAVEDGVVEDPAAAEAGQRRHARDGDDADQHGDEGERHQRDQAAHLVHVAGAGALGDAADREEQHRLVDVVVDDEHQRHQPAEVVHQRQAEQRVAHLADRGIGQQTLGIFLEDRHQVAEQRGEGADPEHDVGQFDAVELLLAHRHQQHEQAVEAGLEQDAGDHRRDIGLGFGVSAGQPDVHADGGGLGHEADGEQQEHPGRDRLRQFAERGNAKVGAGGTAAAARAKPARIRKAPPSEKRM